MPLPLPVKTCKYVDLSDVFLEFPTIKRAFHDGEDYDFTWGDNSRSMITPTKLIDALDGQEYVGLSKKEGAKVDENTAWVSDADWASFKTMLNALPKDVLIDLES